MQRVTSSSYSDHKQERIVNQTSSYVLEHFREKDINTSSSVAQITSLSPSSLRLPIQSISNQTLFQVFTCLIIKMVSFRNIVLAAAACAAPALAALTPAQVVSNIQMVTQKSQALQAPAQSITIINGPLIIIGQGPFPQIIAGFTDIVSTVTTSIAQMQGDAPVTNKADADAIYDAFREVRHLSTFP
jgi:hypothetical protein